MPRFLPYLIIGVVLFLLEVLIATELKHWYLVRAFFGDFLAVICLYCLLQSVRPLPPSRLAGGVFVLACLIELAQLVHLADHLQLRGWMRIVLGTNFSWADIALYAAGASVAWYVDQSWQKHVKAGN